MTLFKNFKKILIKVVVSSQIRYNNKLTNGIIDGFNSHLSALEDAGEMKDYSKGFLFVLCAVSIYLQGKCKTMFYGLSGLIVTIDILALLAYLFYMFNTRRIKEEPNDLETLKFIGFYVGTNLCTIDVSMFATSNLQNILPDKIVTLLVFGICFLFNKIMVDKFFQRFNPKYKLFFK